MTIKNAGGRVRFSQAQYDLESNCPHAHSVALSLERRRVGLNDSFVKAGENQNGARQKMLKDELEKIPSVPDAEAYQAFQAKGVMRSLFGRFQSNWDLYDFPGTTLEIAAPLAKIDEAGARIGLKTVSRTRLVNENLSSVFSEICKKATEGGAYSIVVPRHQMVFFCDPVLKKYRFFDPNFGIVCFDDPNRFAIQVCRYISAIYGASLIHIPEGVELPSLSCEEDFCSHLEAGVSQNIAGSGEVLVEGVCLALSFHVAKSFLERKSDCKLSASLLELPEFDEPDILLNEAKKLFAQEKYNHCVRVCEYLIKKYKFSELDAINESKTSRPESDDFMEYLAKKIKTRPESPVLIALLLVELAKNLGAATGHPEYSVLQLPPMIESEDNKQSFVVTISKLELAT